MTDQGESPILRHLRVLWAYPIHFVVALLVGTSGAFIYSYGPLHRSEQWQIGYLEQRVDEQNQSLRALEGELESLRADAASRPDPQVLAENRKQAANARRELANAEAAQKKSERTIANLRRSVTQWKSRYEQASTDLQALQTAAAPAPAPGSVGTVADAAAPPDSSGSPEPEGSSQPLAAPDSAEIP